MAVQGAVMKHSRPQNTNGASTRVVIWRTLIALLFLYLNFAAYHLLGIGGVILISVFFLIAQFSPFFVHFFSQRQKHAESLLPLASLTDNNGMNQQSRVDQL